LQGSRDTNEGKREKTLFQNLVMEEEQYEEAISKGTAYQFVVPAKQQAHQKKHPAADPTSLHESELEVSSSSHGCADLQFFQPAFVPC